MALGIGCGVGVSVGVAVGAGTRVAVLVGLGISVALSSGSGLVFGAAFAVDSGAVVGPSVGWAVGSSVGVAACVGYDWTPAGVSLACCGVEEDSTTAGGAVSVQAIRFSTINKMAERNSFAVSRFLHWRWCPAWHFTPLPCR